MIKQSSIEKRMFVRARRVMSIQYRLSKSSRKNVDKKWHLSMTQDMSLGGLTFYTDYEFIVNDVIDLNVVMSGVLDIFDGQAKVVRVQKKKSGVYYLIAVKFSKQEKTSRSAKSHAITTTRKKSRSLKKV